MFDWGTYKQFSRKYCLVYESNEDYTKQSISQYVLHQSKSADPEHADVRAVSASSWQMVNIS